MSKPSEIKRIFKYFQVTANANKKPPNPCACLRINLASKLSINEHLEHLCFKIVDSSEIGNPHFTNEFQTEHLARVNKDSPAFIQKFAADTIKEDSKQNR